MNYYSESAQEIRTKLGKKQLISDQPAFYTQCTTPREKAQKGTDLQNVSNLGKKEPYAWKGINVFG